MNKTRRYWFGRNVVYRCFDVDGRLLYVGKTVDVTTRLAAHRREAWWWPLVVRTRVSVHRDEIAAYRSEQQVIRDEGPAFNVRRAGMSDVLGRDHWTEADHALYRNWQRAQARRWGTPS